MLVGVNVEVGVAVLLGVAVFVGVAVGVSVPVGVELGVKVGVGVGAPQVESFGSCGSLQRNVPPSLIHCKLPVHSLSVWQTELHGNWLVNSATVILLVQTAELTLSETVAELFI